MVYPFEDVVLGASLMYPELFDQVMADCQPDDFYNQKLFSLMRSLRQRNLPTDIHTIVGECSDLNAIGGVDNLQSLMNSVVSRHEFSSAFTQFKQEVIKRRLRVLSSSFDSYFNQDTHFDVAVQKFENDMFDITSRVKSVLSSPYQDFLDTLDPTKGKTVHFPLDSVNKKLGGLNPGELCVIGARPAMGKTALICNLLYKQAEAQDSVVAMYSLEMSGAEIFSRFVSLKSGISGSLIRTDQLTDGQRKLVESAAKHIKGMLDKNLRLNDSHATSIQSIRSSLRRIARKQPISLVVIDYLQLLSGPGKSMYERITEISRNCKLIAREFDCVVVALSQLSRAVDSRADKHPTLSDLRESGAIEQDADQVLMLYCDAYYNPPKNHDPSKEVIDIDIAKNRHGSTGIVKVLFNKVNGRFRDLPRKED